jgi:hypothetical protein
MYLRTDSGRSKFTAYVLNRVSEAGRIGNGRGEGGCGLNYEYVCGKPAGTSAWNIRSRGRLLLVVRRRGLERPPHFRAN